MAADLPTHPCDPAPDWSGPEAEQFGKCGGDEPGVEVAVVLWSHQGDDHPHHHTPDAGHRREPHVGHLVGRFSRNTWFRQHLIQF